MDENKIFKEEKKKNKKRICRDEMKKKQNRDITTTIDSKTTAQYWFQILNGIETFELLWCIDCCGINSRSMLFFFSSSSFYSLFILFFYSSLSIIVSFFHILFFFSLQSDLSTDSVWVYRFCLPPAYTNIYHVVCDKVFFHFCTVNGRQGIVMWDSFSVDFEPL